jgi:hypothetical protein
MTTRDIPTTRAAARPRTSNRLGKSKDKTIQWEDEARRGRPPPLKKRKLRRETNRLRCELYQRKRDKVADQREADQRSKREEEAEAKQLKRRECD